MTKSFDPSRCTGASSVSFSAHEAAVAPPEVSSFLATFVGTSGLVCSTMVLSTRTKIHPETMPLTVVALLGLAILMMHDSGTGRMSMDMPMVFQSHSSNLANEVKEIQGPWVGIELVT